MDTINKYLPIKAHWRVFAISFIVVFLMAALPKLGIKLPRSIIVSPMPVKQIDIMDRIRPKLELIPITREVRKPTSFIPTARAASGDFDEANAYGVVDVDSGEVIVSKDFSTQYPMASLTKVMTAVVALDLAKPEERFDVSEKASEVIPTKIEVKPGETYSLEELLNALLLTSANDSAQVIKEGIDAKYGQSVFINAMNEKAKILGLDNSQFRNPQGFDNVNHYSTVEDLANLTIYAMDNYPMIKEIVAKDIDYLPENTYHHESRLNNWNGLIGVYPGAYGVKIGNTGKAKKTTIVMSERSGKRMMAIVLGAPGIIERDMWSAELLDQGFQIQHNIQPALITEAMLKAKYKTWQ